MYKRFGVIEFRLSLVVSVFKCGVIADSVCAVKRNIQVCFGGRQLFRTHLSNRNLWASSNSFRVHVYALIFCLAWKYKPFMAFVFR